MDFLLGGIKMEEQVHNINNDLQNTYIVHIDENGIQTAVNVEDTSIHFLLEIPGLVEDDVIILPTTVKEGVITNG